MTYVIAEFKNKPNEIIESLAGIDSSISEGLLDKFVEDLTHLIVLGGISDSRVTEFLVLNVLEGNNEALAEKLKATAKRWIGHLKFRVSEGSRWETSLERTETYYAELVAFSEPLPF